MHLFSALVPPRDIADDLADVVASVRRPVDVAPTPKRRFGRRPPAPAPVLSRPPLEIVPISDMRFHITTFGNVTTGDAAKITRCIAEAAVDWPAPTVYFAGAVAPDFPRDRSVRARLDGDLDAMTALARGVIQTVERVGLYADRRRFRPVLAVAKATDDTELADVEAAADALTHYRSPSWTVDAISLFTTVFDGPHETAKEIERVPVGRSDA